MLHFKFQTALRRYEGTKADRKRERPCLFSSLQKSNEAEAEAMADSACIMQQNCFSHSSQPSLHPHTQQEKNPDPAFGGSVSLGRFMSESLDWGKWSSFSHNRHLEEVQKCSRPGSVAQKKAYFEAHYKRLAAQRAEALLEEADSQHKCLPEQEKDNDLQQPNAAESDIGAGAGSGSNLVNAKDEVLELESDRKAGVDVDKPYEAELEVSNNGGLTEATGADPNGKIDGSRTSMVKDAHLLTEEKVLSEALVQQIPSAQKLGGKCTCQPEKAPLKERSANSQHSSATARKKSTVSSAKLSILNQVSNVPASPAKSTTPLHFRKENNATPSSKKARGDSIIKNRSTPKSLHLSINFPQYHAGEITPSMAKKSMSPVIEKTRCSKKVLSSSQMIRDSSNAAKAPNAVSTNRRLRLPSETPQLENRRRTPSSENTTLGIPKAEWKWQLLSLDHLKPSSTSGTNVHSPLVSSSNRRSPIVLSPFNFRSDERAAKRKERLEEKFNAKAEMQRIQAKNKEIDGTELTKLRQSHHGFKARPMPDFHRKTEIKNQIKKKLPTKDSLFAGRSPTQWSGSSN
ncbi:hypothetical protein ACLOJK_022923 [Asimina triloba]